MKDYKELKVWQKSHEVTVSIYKVTKDFPDDERFRLTSQIRRAAASVPTNIAEGYGQLTKVNYIRFLGISRGSTLEVEYLLRLCRDLGYLDEVKYKELHAETIVIVKMINGLINALKASQ